MGNNTALPFERGTTQSADGLEGSRFFDEKFQQELMIVKNTDAAALTGKRIVKWEDASKFEVDYATEAAHGPMVAGVVDPELASTVAVNKQFYIVVGGVVTVSVGTGSADLVVGSFVQPSADTDKGKIDAAILTASIASAALVDEETAKLRNKIGVAQAIGSINTDTEILLYRR